MTSYHPPDWILNAGVELDTNSDVEFLQEQKLIAELISLYAGFSVSMFNTLYVRPLDCSPSDEAIVLDAGGPNDCLYAIGVDEDATTGPWEVLCHSPELAARLICLTRRKIQLGFDFEY